MSQETYSTDPVYHGAAQRKAAVSMERLEYRMPGHATGSAPLGASSAGVQPLVEEWLRPAAMERRGTEAGPATMRMDTEEQWNKERAAWESRLAEQGAAASRAVAAAKEEGRREGHQAAEAVFAEGRAQIQRQIVETVEEFRQQRERYFHEVEREVVRLALAIAARVLHRQAQIDPLFLSGAVRVALDKLADTTGVVLRVAPAQVMAWQEMFRLHASARMQPEIMGDLSLDAGECVLETRLGTIELGVGAQLEEIEKGFFDLLHHHPSASPPASNAGAFPRS